MKTIQKINIALVAMITLALASISASAGGGTLYATNSEAWALALLNSPVDYYNGNYSFTAKSAEGKEVKVGGEFRLKPSNGFWVVTRFTVGDEELMIDPNNPLPGFPRYQADKISQFNAWADGFNRSGTSVRYMSFYSPLLRSDDPIQFRMRPNSTPILVAYQVPAGLDPRNLRLNLVGGYQGYWDDIYGGFVIWLDLTRSYDSYQVIDTSRNVVVDSGAFVFNPARGTTDSSGGNEIAIANEGQVQEVDLTHRLWGLNLQRQTATSLLPNRIEGGTAPGKVYAVYMPSADSYLSVSGWGFKPGAIMEVWGFGKEGMEFLSWSTEKDGGLSVRDATGYQGYQVVVWAERAEELQNFSMNFWWAHHSDPVSGGGGGSAVATPVIEGN